MKRTLNALFAAVVVVMFGSIGAFAQQPPKGKQFQPSKISLQKFTPLNFAAAAVAEKEHPPENDGDFEDEIDTPQPKPDVHFGVPIPGQLMKLAPKAAPASPTGPSPGPIKTFKAEFLSATSIPPDTMGAVGTTHIVTVTNDRMRIQTRDGVELSRMTLTAFWAGVTIKGAAISAFDPKVMFDRFNNRFILISSGNGQNVNSGAMFAVSATADPTGTWYRWSVAADPASTAAGGHWIDYPTMGFNKNWIVVDENVFNYGTAGTGYWGQQIYVLDKQAAYSNTLGAISLFQADFNATCLPSPTPETELGCGFTMAPTIVENNTTDEVYLVEDWDSTAAQLRLAKITGTPAAPVLTVGTQFPQSAESWRFNASRLGTANNCGGTCSGGYVPQRQQSANLISGTRIMANDSRVQNAVLRNGKLWCAHTVMLATAPQPAGTTIGGAGNPIDNHSSIQWWQIDPTIETGGSVAPLQRARIDDATANNCHNGSGGTTAVAPCNGTTAIQFGEFFAFPNISVNVNEDVLIGFTRFSPFTYPNSAYVIRRAADPINTTRDPVVFRPGQSNYNIGAGSGTARQNRWGDYSAAQTDPLNDTNFWSVQEYAGTNRNDFLAPSYAGPWETWWALIDPAATVPSTGGSLLISEFRLRGPQGVRDEFVDVYNPGATPIIVNVTDNSEGWALVYSNNGTAFTSVVAVIPNGTVIKPRGHFLIANNPDNTAGGTSALTYSLNAYPSITARNADSDVGWAFDLADNGGLALFKTSTQANMTVATLMDSVGFATIAAGLFKEGAGIPAVSATTPTGQMTFYRNAASGGVPADTGANENDFIFADPVLEVLTATPRVGAAGPENLDGPIHSTSGATVTAAVLDAGAAATAAPNLFRDPTPGPLTTSTFGTITFRRTITNNTGAPLPRLRYRIVDITTNPVTGGNADLRVLTQAANPAVGLSGGGSAAVAGTTLETPPAQAAGGGFNSSLSIPSITLAAPLGAGASTNIAFTAGVQVRGNYNLCLVPEGVAEAAGGPLCFTGITGNVSITAGAPVARNTGDPAANAPIATVSDIEDAPGSLTVTVATAPAGIFITNIVNSGGNVTADVAAGCNAAAGANNVVLQVMDSAGSVANAIFVVNVTVITPPVPSISGASTTCSGVPVILTATSAGAASFQWYRDSILLGGETASTISTDIAGSYTVTALSAGGCASAQSAPHVLTVNPTPSTPSPTNTGPYCDSGSGVTVQLNTATVASATYSWTGPNGFTSALQNPTRSGATPADSGLYSVTVTVSGCTSAAGSTQVDIYSTPATPTATNTGPYCETQTIQLNTPTVVGATYAWTGPNGFTSALQNPTRTNATTADGGSYSVTVTVNGCTSAAGSTTVVVNPTPATPTATNTGPYCDSGSGVTVQLNTPTVAGATYAWTGPNGFTSALQNPTRAGATPSDSGSYSVTVTVSGCTSAAGSTQVDIYATPATPNAGNGGPYCESQTIQLTTAAVAGATYAWTGPNGFTSALQNPTRTNATTADGGSYSVTVTVNGCTSAAGSTNVVVNATPATPTATNGGPYCPTNTIQLNTPTVAGATYAWTGPGGFTSALQNPTRTNATTADSGTYSVTVTVNGCTSAAGTTNVVVNATPATPAPTNTGPYCVGGTIQLNTATVAGATYAWTGPNGFTSALQNPTRTNAQLVDAGSYSVTVTVNGCPSAAGTTNVVVNPIPATPTATNGGPYCPTNTIQLNTPTVAGATYAWTGPNGFTSALQNPTRTNAATADAGTYSVTVTVNGCPSAAGTTNVVVNPTPATPTITPSGATTFCTGGSVTLNSSSASGNQWYLNGGAIGGATGASHVASVAGDYTVVVTTSGCPSAPSAITTVTVNPNPDATITAPGSVTAGSTGNIASVANAGVGATYAWSITNGTITAGNNTPSVTFTAGVVGTLTLQVTVTTQAGCSDTKSANVNVTPPAITVTVTSVVPPAGKTTGGKNVTINGTNFQSGATITFGGSPATNVVFVNSTKLTAKTPAHAAGFVNVTVTNPDTTSGTLVNGYRYVAQQFDANGDNAIDPSDIFYLVNYLFLSGPPPIGAAGMDSGDANGDGVVDPADIFYIVAYLFLGGPAPAAEPATDLKPLTGSLTLGEPVVRGKRLVIPVIVSAAPESDVPQALSLRVVFKGDAPNSAVIHRAGMARELEPAFEISRGSSNSLVYLLSFDPRKNAFAFASGRRSGVIAEIELDAPPGSKLSIEIDPSLTMLVNAGGTRAATVAGDTLEVRGRSVESPSAPMPKKERE